MLLLLLLFSVIVVVLVLRRNIGRLVLRHTNLCFV